MSTPLYEITECEWCGCDLSEDMDPSSKTICNDCVANGTEVDEWNAHYQRPRSGNEEIVLVAFVVYADNQRHAQEQVMDFLPKEKENPDVWSKAELDCWWIGMDERYDGSDLDSLEFVAFTPKEKA